MAYILAVDDDPAIGALIQRALEAEGHDVVAVLAGQAALELARRRVPDLVLLDILMPDMNGIAVCQALRAEIALAAVPVLFLSDCEMIEDKLAAFDAGGDDCLAKPFDPREMVARVRALLRRTQAARPPSAPASPAPGEDEGPGPAHVPLRLTVTLPLLPGEENETAGLPFLQIYALGQARVLRDGHLVTSSEWDSTTTKELFFYFLMHRAGLRKEQVLDGFWRDTPPDRANSVFHSTLYRLRRALGRRVVLFQDGWYYLNPELRVWFDAEAFRSRLDDAHAAPDDSPDRLEALEQALNLYAGDFLEEFYSDWPFFERETLRERYVSALVELADFHTQHGNYPRALELYKSALARDAYREDALRKIVACYSLAGHRGAGMRYYEQWRQLYEADLGVTPDI